MNPDPVINVLTAAIELISTPDQWTKGAMALDDAGYVVSPLGPRAVCWCCEGAVWREANRLAASRTHQPRFLGALVRDAIRRVIDTPDIFAWNDRPDITHADVIAALRRAIEDLTSNGETNNAHD